MKKNKHDPTPMMNEEQHVDYAFSTDHENIVLRRYRDGTVYFGSVEEDLQAVDKQALRWWLRECTKALAESEMESGQ